MVLRDWILNPSSRGVALAVLLACVASSSGCGPNADGNAANAPHHHHGEHADYGPHGGLLIEWEQGGKSYHVELVADRAKQEATVYLMDEELTKASPIDAKSIALEIRAPQTKVVLAAAPQENDPPGTASRFVGKDPALGGEMPLAGAVTGPADGVTYYGSFDEAKAKRPAAEKPAAKTPATIIPATEKPPEAAKPQPQSGNAKPGSAEEKSGPSGKK
jgi:hypothetical protein